MGSKSLLNAHPKNEIGSKGARRCRVCNNQQAIIRKYHLNMCRQCFRERATDIGFVKVRPVHTSRFTASYLPYPPLQFLHHLDFFLFPLSSSSIYSMVVYSFYQPISIDLIVVQLNVLLKE